VTKRSAIAATMVTALLAGVVGANRATLRSVTPKAVVIVQRAPVAAPTVHVATPDRE
jgi:hypothetical protein